jgi:hypothetical protein
VEDGFDEDIEFGDEVSDEGEGDPVDNVSIILQRFVFCLFGCLIWSWKLHQSCTQSSLFQIGIVIDNDME